VAQDGWRRIVDKFDETRPVWPASFGGILVGGTSLVVGRHRGDLSVDVALASMAAFLFGVLIAFTIVRTRDRLVLVQNLVASGNAALLSMYRMLTVFGEDDAENIRRLIDTHLTHQIDYRLVDYHLAAPSFRALADALLSLKLENRQQEQVYRVLAEVVVNGDNDRAQIEAVTGQELSALEWSSLGLLLIVLLGLIAVLPGGSVLGAVVAALLGGTLVMLMILLRKLDSLRWHERVTIWEPTSRLFRSMDLDPYVPRHVVDSGRFTPVGRFRMVEYPDPYPNRSTKIVTLVDQEAVTAPSPV
jgi:hypothetical protein